MDPILFYNIQMEAEMQATVAVRGGFQLQISELQTRLKVMDLEYQSEKKIRVKLETLLNRIRSYMARCMSVLHDYDNLKATVRVRVVLKYFGENIMKPGSFACRLCIKSMEMDWKQDQQTLLNKKLYVNY